MEGSTHQEAVSHPTKGLEVLTTLPNTAERTRHEFDVTVVLGVALTAITGQMSPDGEHVYARTRQGLAACRATGTELLRPDFLSLPAEG